jgi:uncharacterized membrane protein
MTDIPNPPPPPPAPQTTPQPQSAYDPPPPQPSMLSDSRQMALIVYILYLVPGGLTHIIGLILAYVSREGAPDWLKSHYTLQIRTFWMALLYFSVSILLCIVLIGIPMLIAVIAWFYIRCILGLIRLSNNEPYPTPLSWTI